MNERAYRIFILSSTKVSSCMVMAIWTDQMNCSALFLLPLKFSGSAALAPLGEWLPVSIFIKIACATADMALAAASGCPWHGLQVHCWLTGAGKVAETGC